MDPCCPSFRELSPASALSLTRLAPSTLPASTLGQCRDSTRDCLLTLQRLIIQRTNRKQTIAASRAIDSTLGGSASTLRVQSQFHPQHPQIDIHVTAVFAGQHHLCCSRAQPAITTAIAVRGLSSALLARESGSPASRPVLVWPTWQRPLDAVHDHGSS